MEDPASPTLPELLADMEASEAEIAMGLVVTGDVVHQLFRDGLAPLQTEKAISRRRKTIPRR